MTEQSSISPILPNTEEITTIEILTPTEELLYDILNETVPRKYFKDYKIWEINKKIRDYQYKRLVLDLKEDMKDTYYEDYEDYAMLCLNFLRKYKCINDEWLKIKHVQKLHKDISLITKKPKKAI